MSSGLLVDLNLRQASWGGRRSRMFQQSPRNRLHAALHLQPNGCGAVKQACLGLCNVAPMLMKRPFITCFRKKSLKNFRHVCAGPLRGLAVMGSDDPPSLQN